MRFTLAAVVAVALAAPALTAQSNMGAPEKYTAFAVDMSNTAPRANTTPLDITIKRWSTDQERGTLRDRLSQGQDKLLSALQKLPAVGTISTPGSLAYDLHFASQRPLPDGGKMIILATDRPVGAWEAFRQPRSIDYPFTVIQLQLDKNGKGVGKASIATKITQDDDGTIELENFSTEPVMLNDVHPVK
jgi:hypothetical protein